jgi:hypothetical protein
MNPSLSTQERKPKVFRIDITNIISKKFFNVQVHGGLCIIADRRGPVTVGSI